MIRSILALVALFAASTAAQKSAVLGIDLGSQFFKIAVVKTGGFDVVLNEATKRKTATAVSFANGERAFGDSAISQKPRHPKKVAIGMQHLVGKTFDAMAHEKDGFGGYHLPYGFKKDEKRGTVIYDVDGEEYSPDELLGQLFYFMKDMSQKHIEQTVTECVVTVPPYLTEHERRIIIDAAAMVDLSVIMLVNDNTAVAVRYGIEKPLKPGEANNVLFVDVGASHSTATVVSYYERNITSYKKVATLEVMGVAFDGVGGSSVDAKMVEYFADIFDKEHNKKIREDIKAISKLRKDTEKIKTVLSANKETMLVIESLKDDIDFKCKISREELENMNEDFFKSIVAVIEKAVDKSGLPIDEIHQVIPFGAGTRMPKVKDVVLKAMQREVWQPFANTDESAALGAAFVAANFSKSFRLKEYHVYDWFPYSIGIDMNGKKATIFKQGSVMEAKKTISQPLANETLDADLMKVSLAYDKAELLPEGTPTGLASYTITGMKDAVAKYNVTGTPKVSIAVGMHRDAIADVLHAELKVHSMDWVKKQRFVKKNVTEEVPVPVNKSAANGTNGTNATDETERRAVEPEKADDEEKKEEEKEEEKKEEEKKEEEKKEEEKKEEEKKDEGWSFFGSSSKEEKKEEEKKEEEKEEGKAGDDAASNDTNATAEEPKVAMMNVTREKTVEITEEKLEKKLHTVVLNLTRIHDGVPALDDDSFKAAQQRHAKMVEAEQEKVARADAKNGVEAYIFTAREKLGAEEMEKVSTEEDRESISSKLTAAEDWLWEDGDDVEVKVYKEKKSELKDLVEDMFYRYEQLSARASAIDTFKAALKDARQRVIDWDEREAKRVEKNETTWIHANETKRVTKMCDEADTWLTEKEAELETAGLLVKPPFSATEVMQYMKPLANEVSYLRYKPKPKSKKKKKKAKTNTSGNGSNATDADENATASEETKEEETKEEAKGEEAKDEEAKGDEAKGEEAKEEAKGEEAKGEEAKGEEAKEAKEDLPTDEL